MLKKIKIGLFCLSIICPWIGIAATQTFSIVPIVKAPSSMVVGKTALISYRVTNNSPVYLSSNGPIDLPASIIQNTNSGCAYPFNLSSGQNCILNLSVTPTTAGTITAGPTICHTVTSKTICNKPTNISDRIQINAVNTPTGLLTLHVAPIGVIVLQPGVGFDITVTNTSSTISANNVNIDLSPISSDIKSVMRSGCNDIAPGGICHIVVTTEDTPDPNTFPYIATIQGANTQAVQRTLSLNTGNLSASTVTFSQPGSKNMRLTNEATSGTIDVNSIVLSGLNAVTGGNPNPCATTLNPGDYCDVPLTTTTNSYETGSQGLATIEYTYDDGQSKTEHVSTPIHVSKTILSVDGEMQLHRNQANQTLAVKNTGHFNWENPQAVLASVLDGVTMDASDCTSSSVAPSSTCTIRFDANDANPGDSSRLDLTGNNVTTTSSNVVIDDGVVVAPDTNVADYHLGYRAIKVENLSDYKVSLDANPTISSLDEKVSFCPKGDGTACNIESTCNVGEMMYPGNSCLLWFKAFDDGTMINDTAGTISVPYTTHTISVAPYQLTKSVGVLYRRNLYVAGAFTMSPAGQDQIRNIAQWNGVAWGALGSGSNNGTDNTIYAMTSDKYGDLIAGGRFLHAGGEPRQRIALWNGHQWKGMGGVNNVVYALAQNNDGDVIAGGSFTSAGEVSVARRAAKWSPDLSEPWTAMGTGLNNTVYALLKDTNGDIIAGGTFYQDGNGNDLRKVGYWNGAAWQQVGSSSAYFNAGSSGDVRALGFDNTGNLFAGGSAFDAGSSRRTARLLGSLSTGSWSSYSSGINNGVVHTFAKDASGNLMVGGSFTTSGGSNANRIAILNGTTWDAITSGVGFNSTVYHLLLDVTGHIFAAGSFSAFDSNYVDRVAVRIDGTWGSLNTGLGGGTVYNSIVLPSLSFF